MTNISSDDFKPFFRTEEGKIYVDKIVNSGNLAVIDFDQLVKWNPNLTKEVLENAMFFKCVHDALESEVRDIKSDVSFFDISLKGESIPYVQIHNLSASNVGKFVRIKGYVARTHFIKPIVTTAAFRCQKCEVKDYENADIIYIKQRNPFTLTTPAKCEICDCSKFNLIQELSEWGNSQEFALQETHEDSSGRIPQLIHMITHEKHLMNKIYCGDEVEIIGVVRLMPTYRFRSKSRTFNTYIQVYHITKDNKDPNDIEISQEEEEQILALSQEKDIYDKLIYNVAPSIFGMEKCKEAALLSMFGGVSKDRGDITIRGNIHVLFVGDAGLAKSQLLLAITDLVPKGVFSVGKGVTGAGLTAALRKDEITGEWVIEAGALILAHNGVACIDELDKMNKDDRINIHEAMANQRVTIRKGGRHTILPAKTAVIAACNPTLGKYDSSKSVFDNVNFPPTLFSRFDVIFVLIDNPEPENDKFIVSHMLSEPEVTNTIDRELFKKYIAYAKKIKPILTKVALADIEEYFLKIRAKMTLINDDENHILSKKFTITYRQLEGLVRLTEAHARILLKAEADETDADAAIKLFKKYLVDIDFDVIGHNTGESKDSRTTHTKMADILIRLSKSNSNGVPRSLWIQRAWDEGISSDDANKIIISMSNSGRIKTSRSLHNEIYYKKL